MKKITKAINKGMKKGKKFIENIETDSKVLLVAHRDGDGVISAAIVNQILKEKGITSTHRLFIISRGEKAREKINQELEELKNNTVIFLDYTPSAKTYKELFNEGKKVLTIDHHPGKTAHEKGVYINPWTKGILPAAAVICHKLYLKCNGKKDTKPWALIAAYLDTRVKQSLEYIDMNTEEEEIYFPSMRIDWDLLEVIKALGAASFDASNAQKSFEMVEKSIQLENPVLIAEEKYGEAKELFNVREKSYKEKIKETKRAQIEKDEDSKLVVATIKPKRNIKSMVVDHLRLKYPGYTVAVTYPRKGNYFFSFRSSEKDLSKAVPRACEGIDANGGGHSKAAGGRVKEKHFREFIENFKEQLKKQENKLT